jgi:hypothetical protein
MHGHVSVEQAGKLIDQGQADWERSPKLDRFGVPKMLRSGEPQLKIEPAIRLKRKRGWKPKYSGTPETGGMRVWQLVT